MKEEFRIQPKEARVNACSKETRRESEISNSLNSNHSFGKFPSVKLRTDSQRRLYGRDILKADTIYEANTDGSGRITLVELAPKEAPRAKLVRRGGKTYLQSSRPITNEDIRKVMDEFP